MPIRSDPPTPFGMGTRLHSPTDTELAVRTPISARRSDADACCDSSRRKLLVDDDS